MRKRRFLLPVSAVVVLILVGTGLQFGQPDTENPPPYSRIVRFLLKSLQAGWMKDLAVQIAETPVLRAEARRRLAHIVPSFRAQLAPRGITNGQGNSKTGKPLV